MISVLGAAFVLATGLALVLRPSALPWILSAAVPFSATAGLTVAGQSVVMYPLVALVVVGVALRRAGVAGLLRADVSTRPGLRPLVAFGVWAVTVTVVAPIAFAGMPVLDPREGIDDGVKAPAALALGISNLAQVGYLVIGIATVVALASWPSASSRLPAAGFATGTVLSSLRSLLPESAQKSLFDNSANVSYTAGTFDGVERMRGVFSEPSALGAFSVAATVFFIVTASSCSGRTRIAFTGLGAWAAANAVLSFSGGALVSGLIVLVVVLLQRIVSYARGRLSLSPGGLVVVVLSGVAVIVLGPLVYGFVTSLFGEKTGSSSYENRNAADVFSYSLAHETMGVGVGVGSNRPSSFLASLLSTTGVLGVAFLLCAIAVVAVHAGRRPEYQAAVGALVATVISKLVSGPDISEPAMWFLLAVCASACWGRSGPASTEVGPGLTADRSTGASVRAEATFGVGEARS